MIKLLLAALLLMAPAAAQTLAKPFTLTSTSFRDGEMLSTRYGGNNPASPNCIGKNVSPALAWANSPAGTTSIAFTLVDPEGRDGAGVVHWVAYGIRPEHPGFAEGALSAPNKDHVGGKGTRKFTYYMGPCAPGGVAPHHYTFLAYATDLPLDALPPGLTRDELLARLLGHVKGIAGLVGRYVKPTP